MNNKRIAVCCCHDMVTVEQTWCCCCQCCCRLHALSAGSLTKRQPETKGAGFCSDGCQREEGCMRGRVEESGGEWGESEASLTPVQNSFNQSWWFMSSWIFLFFYFFFIVYSISGRTTAIHTCIYGCGFIRMMKHRLCLLCK